MLINYVACRTSSHSACSNLVAAMEGQRYRAPECLARGLVGRDDEGLMWGRWLRLWQRWWPMLAIDEGRRRVCRGERVCVTTTWGGRTVACGKEDGGQANGNNVGRQWPWWREKEEKIHGGSKNRGELIFGDFWTRFFSYSIHEIHPCLYGVEEGSFVFNGVKYWPLVRLGRISTVGSK